MHQVAGPRGPGHPRAVAPALARLEPVSGSPVHAWEGTLLETYSLATPRPGLLNHSPSRAQPGT